VALCRASPRSLLAVTGLLPIFAFPNALISGDGVAFEYQPQGSFWNQDSHQRTNRVPIVSSLEPKGDYHY
jgi:hypothetical protein